jgi:hypothetical protein
VVDANWPHRQHGAFFGHGHLVNGQHFGSRGHLWLEGGHAEFLAGIAGSPEQGAWSVVMGLHDVKKKNVYADVDCGKIIYYMGTALAPENGEDETVINVRDPADDTIDIDDTKATRGTKALIRSCHPPPGERRQPVRLFRSGKAAKIVPNKPPGKTYRYDGLYDVVDYEILNKRRLIYRFKMVRQKGQPPLRGLAEVEAKQAELEAKRQANRRRKYRDAGEEDGEVESNRLQPRRRRRIDSEGPQFIRLDP